MGKAIIFFIPDIEIFWSFGFLVWLGGETGLGLGGWTVKLYASGETGLGLGCWTVERYASGETGLGLGGWTVELYASGETGLGLGCWLLCDCTENVLQLCMADRRGAGKLWSMSSLYLVDIDITEVLPDVLADKELSALASESSVSDFINAEGGGNGLELESRLDGDGGRWWVPPSSLFASDLNLEIWVCGREQMTDFLK